MVAPLRPPRRPLHGGRAWTWQWREPSQNHPWGWCRVYHRDSHTPDATTHRAFGPLHRLDPHVRPEGAGAGECARGRSVLYAAGSLATALGEVFGDLPEARICPSYRVALVRPIAPISVLDLLGQGAAMRVGALPSLATGAYPRAITQEWARAIYDDRPAGAHASNGVYYNAAHSNGPALALWDTDGRVEVVRAGGRDQDFALADPQMRSRVVAELSGLRIRSDFVPACPRCP